MHFSGPRLRLTALLLPLAVLACDGDDVSGPTGAIEVTSLTSGIDPDPDGYTVMLDGRGIGSVGLIGPTRMRYSRAIDAVDSLSRAINRMVGGG